MHEQCLKKSTVEHYVDQQTVCHICIYVCMLQINNAGTIQQIELWSIKLVRRL